MRIRLAALRSLTNVPDDPKSVSLLCNALPVQQSPMVQLAILDALASHRGDCVTQSIHTLLSRGDLEREVRGRAEQLLTDAL